MVESLKHGRQAAEQVTKPVDQKASLMLDSLNAVQARIAEIQQRIATVQPAVQPADGSFSTFLANAMRPADASADGTPTAHSHASVPAALAAFGNGRIPAAALTPIGRTGHRLWAPAAEAFERMAADAARDGVVIRVTDSYRSYDAQVDVARRKGLYRNGGLAAEPGTSTHGWGLSVDVDATPQVQNWLRQHAGRYGFVEDVPREPWHWTYHGAES